MGEGQTVRLGTRGSPLAREQAAIVERALRTAHPGITIESVVIRTTGDRFQDRPLSEVGDKGVFVRGIEQGLLDGTIDLAVHSLKDVPADVDVPGLELVAYSPREDPHDVLISRSGAGLMDLPPGARIGTSSARRRVQLLALRPDLTVEDIRGNVDTRLRKVQDGDYDAVILAAAGLARLGLGQVITQVLPFDAFTPDPGQGIIVVQGRKGERASQLAQAIDDATSHAAADAEREVVRALGADCHSPVGALAEVNAEVMTVTAMAFLDPTGPLVRASVEGSVTSAAELGARLGADLLARVGPYTDP
jgi:hydroxymethylbilane synthase